MPPSITSEAELLTTCKQHLRMLFAVNSRHQDKRISLHVERIGDEPDTVIWQLFWAAPAFAPTWGDLHQQVGLTFEPAENVSITSQLLGQVEKSLANDRSDLRKASSWPVRRTFVYLDISDFSTAHPSGHQVLILNDLARLIQHPNFRSTLEFHSKEGASGIEAMMCVGDGYVFACTETEGAIALASLLAVSIEQLSAHRLTVPFSFRIGIHVGDVNYFWDIGRNGWNYMGDGIIASRRVLEAIGKEVDNVIFVSDAVQQSILVSRQSAIRPRILPALSNRGRRYDKHNRAWRVYELDHFAVTPPGSPLSFNG